jgi:type I restriction enzyme, S subunit
MSRDPKPTITPNLRFPEFLNEPGWEEKELRSIANPVSERAENEDANNILTLSGEHGLVLQREYFGKQIAGANADRYLKIQRDDFVYNDRTTKASAYGTIKRLTKHPNGIVSPIYKCFRFKKAELPGFWEWYFESGAHEPQLRSLANEGARAGRFNVSIDRFLSTRVWTPDSASREQQKIAECLCALDELIEAESQKLDALKAHKKALMQQLFPREGETLPRLRFPEFRDEWKETTMGAECHTISSGRDKIEPEGRFDLFGSTGVIGKTSHGTYSGSNILVARVGANAGLLTKASGEYGVTDNTLVITLKDQGCIDFVLPYLNNYNLNRLIFGSGQPLITGGQLKALPVYLPSEPEREHIANFFSFLDTTIIAQRNKLDALKTHKQGLMQQLFPAPTEAAA